MGDSDFAYWKAESFWEAQRVTIGRGKGKGKGMLGSGRGECVIDRPLENITTTKTNPFML
jgi:hypothetical protein